MSEEATVKDIAEAEEDLAYWDEFCGFAMAYFGYLTDLPKALNVNPNSPLATHNRRHGEAQQHLNPSHLSWRAIASAGEHAGFAEHMRYVTGGGIVARPQTSLARTVLLGASRVIYLLSPESANERVIRAAKVANQEANDARRMLKTWSEQTDPSNDFLTELDYQTSQLAEGAARNLVKAGLTEKSSIKEFEMLTTIAPGLSDYYEDPEAVVLSYWNRASGVAHARAWTWSTPWGRTHPQVDFVSTWQLPVLLLTKAWEIWNIRRGEPDYPHFPPEGWEPDRERWGIRPAGEV